MYLQKSVRGRVFFLTTKLVRFRVQTLEHCIRGAVDGRLRRLTRDPNPDFFFCTTLRLSSKRERFDPFEIIPIAASLEI